MSMIQVDLLFWMGYKFENHTKIYKDDFDDSNKIACTSRFWKKNNKMKWKIV